MTQDRLMPETVESKQENEKHSFGFVGKAVYSTVGQSRVDIDWITTATLNDTVDIRNKDQNINIFILQKTIKVFLFRNNTNNVVYKALQSFIPQNAKILTTRKSGVKSIYGILCKCNSPTSQSKWEG
ncbi:hypothetical protein KUTeg_006405 [Tegillarca granosa]|uniref:Uncharacterized protein n=1 Tax=Tegillarca granosa TaxID=220873 RepID=A0ABQ9FJP5_TEGGR|nr:hypothetical protein KUTeg_006405 [Tegillarca granosa]